MTAAASCFKEYSGSTAVPIAALGVSAREAIAGIGARAAEPACNAFPPGNGSVEPATAVEMNRVGLRSTSSGSFPALFAKTSATDAPAFAQLHRPGGGSNTTTPERRIEPTNLDSEAKN